MNGKLPAFFGLFGLAFGLSAITCASATTITIINNDGAGEGFNDATAATPANGNPGATLGAQRLFVFQQAANQWAALLNSNVEIRVQAQMNPLTCSGTSATLGSAGPLATAANFLNAPRMNISYSIAEANSWAGSDLNPASDDISAQFNVDLDNGTCLTGVTGWYYGTDPNAVPNNQVPLLPVVFHELGHGLGFISLVSTSTGAYLSSRPPIWSSYLYDEGVGLLWNAMSNAQRLTSTTNDPNLVWTGPRTNKQGAAYLKPSPSLIINSPGGLPTPNSVGTATFGAAITGSMATADLVYVNDGVAGAGSPAGTLNDGCETPFTNAAALAGKIAFIDRGFCNFVIKAANAQANGAIGVIIANVASSASPTVAPNMSGSNPAITIPVVSINLALGDQIRTAIGGGTVNATIGTATLATREGCVRMFAPNPLQAGSSVSHFHTDATPNLLMEPSLNTSLFNKVDLTLPLFQDIDWSTNTEDFLFVDGYDDNPCHHVQP